MLDGFFSISFAFINKTKAWQKLMCNVLLPVKITLRGANVSDGLETQTLSYYLLLSLQDTNQARY